MTLRLLFLSLLGLSYASLSAKVTLPAIFSDHMVLQQQAFVAIWGRAIPGEFVTVEASWDGSQISTITDSKGKWLVRLNSPRAGGPFELRIKGENEIILRDVLIGEVWLASGQSNMEWPLSRSANGQEAIAEAAHPNIRWFKVGREVSSTPRFDVRGSWRICSPAEAGEFSAVAYHYARRLQAELGVPVGIVQSTWGGTPAQAWMNRTALERIGNFQSRLLRYDQAQRAYRDNPQLPNPTHQRSPATLYNAMIAPLIPFTLRGVIWYQGEANRDDPLLYRELFPALIRSWRQDWGQALSFYFVQLAPFQYEAPLIGAGVREAQRLSLSLPQTGMAVTLDIGNPNDIHPRDKQSVGLRLARWALHLNYGQKELAPSGPLYRGLQPDGQNLVLEFDYAESGLRAQGESLTGFEVAGTDRRFYPARARIIGQQIEVQCDQVPAPIAVRYAFQNVPQGNLYNGAGLPASSFRSDSWPLFFSQPRIQAHYEAENKQFRVRLLYESIEGAVLRYTLDGSEPDTRADVYKNPFTIQEAATLKIKAFQDPWASSWTLHHPLLRHLALGAKLSGMTSGKELSAESLSALLDGQLGSEYPQDGHWVALRGKEGQLTLDLGKKVNLRRFETHLLHHPLRNMHLPEGISLSLSTNGKKYKMLSDQVVKGGSQSGIYPIEVDLAGQKARYIRLQWNHSPDTPDRMRLMLDEWVVE